MEKYAIILILFLTLVYPAVASENDPDSTAEASSKWSGGVEMTAADKYLWRGMTVNEGFILQPLAWVTCGNLTFSLWSSWTLNEPSDDIRRPEVDPTIAYEWSLSDLTIEGSFSYYYYIDQSDVPNTGELGLALGYPVGIVTFNLGAAVDVIEYPGALYLEQKIEAEKEFCSCLSASGAVTLASGLKKFNEAYFEWPESKTYMMSLEGRLTYSTSGGLYLQPYFQYNKTIDNDLKAVLKKYTSSIGVTIGREF
jgi:hypothetical protein